MSNQVERKFEPCRKVDRWKFSTVLFVLFGSSIFWLAFLYWVILPMMGTWGAK